MRPNPSMPATARAAMIACLLVVAACESTPKVNTDFDPAADFSRYRSYSWVYSETPRGMNPLTFQRVKASIDRSLQARSYTPGGPGDFAVAFTVGRRDSVEVTQFGSYGPYYRGGWGWGGWGGYRSVDVRNVTSGTVVIDIYDTATKKPVWHGMVSKEVNPNKPPAQADIDAAVDAVLAQFPPHPAAE